MYLLAKYSFRSKLCVLDVINNTSEYRPYALIKWSYNKLTLTCSTTCNILPSLITRYCDKEEWRQIEEPQNMKYIFISKTLPSESQTIYQYEILHYLFNIILIRIPIFITQRKFVIFRKWWAGQYILLDFINYYLPVRVNFLNGIYTYTKRKRTLVSV